MTRTAALAAALLAVVPAAAQPAPAAAPKEAPAAERQPSRPPERKAAETWSIDWRVAALAGAFSGQKTRTDSGGLLLLDASLNPAWERGALAVELPLRLAHRQTIGASLAETRVGAAVEPSWRTSKAVKLGAEAGLVGVYRPKWPDQYQREASGLMPGTDRYSHLEWRIGANFYAQPAPHHHLRLRYRLVSTTYPRDPAFDPATPMHLTPRDNVEHRVSASWRRLQPSWAVALRLDTAFRRDSVYLARRAGTGGSSGNPNQRLNDYEPSIELELRKVGGLVDLSLGYGHETRVDGFQGYYSFSGHHPRLDAAVALTPRIGAHASLEAWLRTYGPDSKTNTEDGARLFERKVRAAGELAWQLDRGLSLVARAAWTGRTTNYPDYVSGVFPATRFYDIRWDYDNLEATVGVGWKG